MKTILKKIINAVIICFKRFSGKQSIPEQPGRIGVIACHWLGDTFWASQTIPYLQQRFPDAEIHIFLRRDFADLFYNMIAPENIHLVPEVISDRKREKFSWMKLIAAARKYRPLNFELVIDLTGNRYSALFTRLLKPEYSAGFEGDEFGALYSIRVTADSHKRKRLLKVIQAVGGIFDPAEFPQPPETPLSFESVCRQHALPPDIPVVLMAPKAGWAEKEWGIDNFAGLAALLSSEGFQIIILGMPVDKAECGRIMDHAGVGHAVFFAGTLKEVFALMEGSAIFIGADSGLGHIAASFEGCRTVMIFKATDPAELVPLGAKAFALDGRNKAVTADEVLSYCRRQ
ncbi:MAG: glycosyltransferase family 9 protein [Lentisphaerota bacterium]